MRNRISFLAIISLSASLLSMLLFSLLFETYGSANSILTFLWIISSIVSVILPTISKRYRIQTGSGGKIVECCAMVIGFFSFNFVLLFKTSINGTVCLLITAIFVVAYVKLFSDKEDPAVSVDLEKFEHPVGAEPTPSLNCTNSTPIISESVITDEPVPCPSTNSNPKQRYCQLCGGAVDIESKKCTKCGKQYFNLRHALAALRKLFIIILALVLITAFLFLIASLTGMKSEIITYQSEVSALTAEIQTQQDKIDRLSSELEELKEKYQATLTAKLAAEIKSSFYDEYIVFPTIKRGSSAGAYHKYDCAIFQAQIAYGALFSVADARSADSCGLPPCSECCN